MEQSIHQKSSLYIILKGCLKHIQCYFVELLKCAVTTIRYRQSLNKARSELSKVTDWQLEDIGLSRADVVFGEFRPLGKTLNKIDD